MSSFSKAVIPYCFPEISPSSMSDAVTTATKGGARLEVPFVPGAKTDGLGERIDGQGGIPLFPGFKFKFESKMGELALELPVFSPRRNCL